MSSIRLSTQCHQSLRKYFCGTYMLQPQVQKLGDILLLNGVDLLSNKIHVDEYKELNTSAILELNVYIPGYPENRICQDYATSCQEFIANSQGLAQGTYIYKYRHIYFSIYIYMYTYACIHT
jgi:hypothetical protein